MHEERTIQRRMSGNKTRGLRSSKPSSSFAVRIAGFCYRFTAIIVVPRFVSLLWTEASMPHPVEENSPSGTRGTALYAVAPDRLRLISGSGPMAVSFPGILQVLLPRLTDRAVLALLFCRSL